MKYHLWYTDVSLQLAYNSLTVEGALTLINVVKNTPKTAIEEINICVSANCFCFRPSQQSTQSWHTGSVLSFYRYLFYCIFTAFSRDPPVENSKIQNWIKMCFLCTMMLVFVERSGEWELRAALRVDLSGTSQSGGAVWRSRRLYRQKASETHWSHESHSGRQPWELKRLISKLAKILYFSSLMVLHLLSCLFAGLPWSAQASSVGLLP